MTLVSQSGEFFVHGHTSHDLGGVREALEGLGSGKDIVVGYELLARGRLVGLRVGTAGRSCGIHARLRKNLCFLWLLIIKI